VVRLPVQAVSKATSGGGYPWLYGDSTTDRRRRGAAGESGTNEQASDPSFFDGGHVAAAVRTADGEVYNGVSLPTAVGRASPCGEPVAIGSAVVEAVDLLPVRPW